MIYLRLFFEFFKIGLFAFGGGMATLPFLFELGSKYPNWFTEAELLDMIAISEATPGPIGINMSTYVGFKVAGFTGSFLSTFALVLPSFLVLTLLSNFLSYSNNKYVKKALFGLRVAVVLLLGIVVINLLRLTFPLASTSVFEVIVFAVVFLSLFLFKKIPFVVYVFICGIIFLFIAE